MGVNAGVGHIGQQVLKHARHHRLANPAQEQAGEVDAKLHSGPNLSQALMQFLNGARANAAGLDQLLQARIAHADQAELGGHYFFFNDTATTEIYTLSLHDALPISYHRLGAYDMLHRGNASQMLDMHNVIAVLRTQVLY